MPMPAPPPDRSQLDERRQAFGNRLRDARHHVGLTQEQLALRAGMDRSQYSELERGQRDARLSTLLRIERVLGANLSFVVDGPAAATGDECGGPTQAAPYGTDSGAATPGAGDIRGPAPGRPD
ncbi:helix-turn-helix domain-containing protein [Streptomyces phaeolivaceus]